MRVNLSHPLGSWSRLVPANLKVSFVFIRIRNVQLISHHSELHSVLKSCGSSGKLPHARAYSSS